MTGIKKQRE